MPINFVRSVPRKFALSLALLAALGIVPSVSAQKSKSKRRPTPAVDRQLASDEISGMYTFLRDGEFVQITVEDGKLSGFVSRYGERDSDRDAFLDQFFSKGSIEGKKIAFTTKPIHGTWFEFSGETGRGEAKAPDKEGYWVIHGTLKQFDQDEMGKVSAKSREVTFKSFPQETQ